MKILHIVAGIWEHTGGPAEVIPQLCEALVQKNYEVTLLSIDGPHSEAARHCSANGVEFLSFPAISFLPVRYSPEMNSYLRTNIHKFDIVHNHGHWLHPNWLALKHAKRHNKPLVTTPHGTLVPGMLSRSKIKKWFSWHLFDRWIIQYANIIHSLSAVENQEMSAKIGSSVGKIRIIPNGAEIWDLPSPNNLLKKFPKLEHKKIILFLSRVHPIKGVVDLLETWKLICRGYSDWHLLIVGPIEKEIEVFLNKTLEDQNLQDATTLTGPIYGVERLEAFAVADGFTLPSYGEGLPTAILEALSCRIPVVCTDECNFFEAEKAGAAFSGPAGKDMLLFNLEKLMNMTDSTRAQMGEKGQWLIKEKYSWKSIAEKWVQIYSGLL